MMKFVALVAVLAVCVAAAADFEAFKAKFNRKYESHAEEQKRKRIFTENMKTA
jgi:hypothetical protein